MGDLIFRKSVLLGALALGVSLSPLNAQSVDEVIVTGSYINQSAEDAPVPVDVINSEELFYIGNPSVVELVKTLGVSSGVDGETNQFQSNGLEGTANVNLRGLGATLKKTKGRLTSLSRPFSFAYRQTLLRFKNPRLGIIGQQISAADIMPSAMQRQRFRRHRLGHKRKQHQVFQ